jgi:exopolyphosphatase/guanosine-5'-triphosphate,3'-diphosphate pyrophosphatase
MTEIVPRWEWRTFGADLGEAEARLAALPREHVEESDETYVLSEAGDASVKVRGGVLDVKRLERVEDGLEQWRPVLKASFPVAAAALREALGVALDRDEYTLDQLAAVPGLRAVAVHKRREHVAIGGCMAEVSELSTAEGSARTVAIESEDPALVRAAVRGLGLDSRPNVSVPRGLKALVGFGARRFAVLDVGTNSVKFHVGERRADGAWTTVVDRSEITRLGEGLAETGRLGEEPIRRTVDAIADMAAEAERDGVEATAAVGTAGMRAAPNRDELVDAVQERCGVRIEVISGEEEARLAYVAATGALRLGPGPSLVFDTGGGSSQFTFGHDGQVDERFSVDVGAVRFTERFGLDGAVSEAVVAEAKQAIAQDLSRLDGHETPGMVIGLGGANTNLAAVKHGLATYDADVVQGTVLDRAELDRQIELYRTRTADERRDIPGLQPQRAEVILAGACVIRTVLEQVGAESLTVSDRGLRHGLLLERFGP